MLCTGRGLPWLGDNRECLLRMYSERFTFVPSRGCRNRSNRDFTARFCGLPFYRASSTKDIRDLGVKKKGVAENDETFGY